MRRDARNEVWAFLCVVFAALSLVATIYIYFNPIAISEVKRAVRKIAPAPTEIPNRTAQESHSKPTEVLNGPAGAGATENTASTASKPASAFSDLPAPAGKLGDGDQLQCSVDRARFRSRVLSTAPNKLIAMFRMRCTMVADRSRVQSCSVIEATKGSDHIAGLVADLAVVNEPTSDMKLSPKNPVELFCTNIAS